MGVLGQSTFTQAICSCTTVGASAALTTDGFNSTLGPPDGGLGGGVGSDQNENWTQHVTIGGNLQTPGNLSSTATSLVRGNLLLGGTASVSATLTVDGNASVVKTLPSKVVVEGTTTKVSSVAAPCDCTNIIPVASIVSSHSSSNDNATIGLSANAATGSSSVRIDLPCGNYYLSQINMTAPLTIWAHGHTALYIGGNVNASQTLTFGLDSSATLDIFIAGNVATSNTFTLGSTSYPAQCRTYMAGSSLDMTGGSTIGCNLYAPSVVFDTTATTTVYGSLFVDSFTASAATTVHYDQAIQSASNECCSAQTCDDGNPCTTDSCNGDGTCNHSPVANGTTCPNGSNKCEQTYTCQAGVCTGSNPVTCTAEDQCHVAGTCDPTTGACSNPAASDGTSCNDSDACTQTDTCRAGVCTGSNQITCTAQDQCHAAGTCNPATGTCSNPTSPNGTTCNDGNACDLNDTCQSGVCTAGGHVTCAATDQCHTGGTCNPSSGLCSNPPAPNGTTCSDGNACDLSDTCQAGVCTAGSHVTCAASDQCHAAGTCNPATGQCSNPAAPNGTACGDGNACDLNDTCQSGVCTAGSHVTCAASDQCHVAGTCNPSTGQCSNPTAANGTACNDGNACDLNDTCQSGVCAAGSHVTCTASDQCHVAGTCNPSTGQCSNPSAADGTSCNDGNACTQADACQSGACTGANPVTCTASDQCHTAGTCNPSTGQCSNPAAANGTSCSDGNACTQTDTCQAGTCAGSNPITCTASDQCHSAGTCDPATGTCSNPASPNGTSCSDGNACTQTDTCQGGTCTGSNPVACTASDQCHTAGTCDPSSGQCSNPTSPNGTSCNDGNACTQTDACSNGTCSGSNPVTCAASDQCHTSGTCDPTSGQCSNPPVPDGSSCTGTNACNQTYTCTAGVCTGSNPVVCQPPQPQIVATGDMLSPLSEQAAVELSDGDVLVTGGTPDGEDTSLADVETYHTASGTWTQAAPMNSPRYGHTATLLANGQVLVAGGVDNSGLAVATAEVYDPAKNAWAATGAMNVARDQNEAVLLASGQVLVVGYPADTGPFAELFDPTSGTWSPATTVSQGGGREGSGTTLAPGVGVGEFVTLLADGRVLAAGGSAFVGASNAASIYDPSANAWTQVANMPEARAAGAGALLPGGNVICAGGVGGGSAPVLADAVIYDPIANAWTAAGTMSVPRSNGAGASLPNGNFVFTGGNAAGADMYNPATGKWSALSSNANLFLQTATLDGAGSILIAGGNDTDGNTLSSAELLSAPDAQCTQSSCNPQTGQCSTTTNVANGTACNAGNACLQTQACQGGYCVGSNPVTCPSGGLCQLGECNPKTGACSTVAVPNGTACNDGNLCELHEACQSGVCSGLPVTCFASDQCHVAGICSPSTGQCSNPTAPNGTTCNDGNHCDLNDTCQAGVCTAGSQVTCAASDQCHVAGTCNPVSGQCSNPAAPNGTACNDGNLCDLNDTCQSGACTAGNSVTCTASDQCHVAGTCDPSSGQCSNPAASNGTTCNDGNACTRGDTCQSGTCTGSTPVTCSASDQCHQAGSCDPSTGTCSNPDAPDGTSCNGNDLCFGSFACQSGACSGSNPVVCQPSDQCHLAGTCNQGTGTCSSPPAPNGTSCNDGNPCTQNDICSGGLCSGTGSCDGGANSDASTSDGGDAGDGGSATHPPLWPAGSTVTAVPTGNTSVFVFWSAATDPTGVTGYDLYANGSLIATLASANRSYQVSGLVNGQTYTFAVQAGNGAGLWSTNGPTTTVTAAVNVPTIVAPPLDRSVVTSVASDVAFLYSGPNAIQLGLTATVDGQRVSALQGVVTDSHGGPLSGVAVIVADHPEYGATTSRADGHYDLVVNGGGLLTVAFRAEGFLAAERTVHVPWQNYIRIPTVALLSRDGTTTQVNLSSGSGIQTARASQVSDAYGSRQATLMFNAGTTAQMVLPSGQVEDLTSAHMRATEFTVGSNGPAAMPAELPPTSGYTYALALTVDEAEQANATQVTFSTPVAFYLENFLNFPTGMHVPSGYFDPASHTWIPSKDGLVVTVLSISGGQAVLDVDGAGQPATPAELSTLGVTTDELTQIASLYQVNQTLWRVPVAHFSSWDFNTGSGPPPGGDPPPPSSSSSSSSGGSSSSGSGGSSSSGSGGPTPIPPDPIPDPDCQSSQQGCIVDVEGQVLGESVPVGGTPYTLNYRSNRVPDRVADRTVSIPLTSATPPSPLLGVTLETDIAGQHQTQQFGPGPSQSYTFTWDGNDAFGRRVQGSQTIHARIGYVYDLVALTPSDSPNMAQYDQEFGHYSYYGHPVSTNGRQITIWYDWYGTLGEFDEIVTGLGGWSLSVHHAYDPESNRLYYGDGRWRSTDTLPPIITVIQGDQSPAITGLPGPNYTFYEPVAVTVGPDGTIFVLEGQAQAGFQNCRIQAVAPNGSISTIAGTTCGYGGDGGPATQAKFLATQGNTLSAGADGSLYIADGSNCRIRKIDPNGIITTFAGTGTCGFPPTDNGVPALSAKLTDVVAVAAAADGSVYAVENDGNEFHLIRISRDGYVRQVVTNAAAFSPAPSGVPLSQAYVHLASTEYPGMAVGDDGTVFFPDTKSSGGSAWSFLRKVSPAGVFSTVAGSANFQYLGSNPVNDGQLATSVVIDPSQGPIATAKDGSVFFWDNTVNWVGPSTTTHSRVRWVRPDGIIKTLAGNGTGGINGPEINYQDESQWGAAALAPVSGNLASGQTAVPISMAVAPDGSVVLDELWPGGGFLMRVQPPVVGSVLEGYVVASENGGDLYQFDPSGRHTATRDTLTGATRYAFSYDAGGRLTAVTDVNGDTTTIQHDAHGNPTLIVGPFGQQTALTSDGNGYLSSMADAVGDTYNFTSTPGGLLQSTVTPRSGPYTYTYDSLGRLTADIDPAGGGAELTSTTTNGGGVQGVAVVRTTAMGLSSNYQAQNLSSGDVGQSVTDPAGFTTASNRGANGTNVTTAADGTVTSWTLTGDPRFGMQAPFASTTVVTTPSGLTSTTTVSNLVTLSDPANVLSLQTATTTRTTNGQAWASVFNQPQMTRTRTSPLGRQSVITIDAAGRPLEIAIPNTNPIVFTYDAHGRLITRSQGNSAMSQGYDALGYLGFSTDSMGNTTSFTNDPVGRHTKTMLPDNRQFLTGYDDNGNVTTITVPSQNVHAFGYSPVDLLSSYSPPSVGQGSWSTAYYYDLDGRRTSVVRPDGVTISYGYDAAGRRANLQTPQGAQSYAYSQTTGHLTSITTAAGETTTYSYDGFLRTGLAWSGLITGSIAFGFDNNFRMTSQVVNGSSVSFGYDADGLLTQAGSMMVTRDPLNGRVIGSTLGAIKDAYTYDGNGLFASYTAQFSGSSLYAESVQRDLNGRITQKSETVGTTTHVWGYTYDLNGRLTDVSEDGQFVSHYAFDADDNRTTYTNAQGTLTATYDAQDRLQTYGAVTYGYTRDGELTSRTDTTGVTSYAYDALGNLAQVSLPGGTSLSYAVDGEGRRVGRYVNSALAQGFLYQDQLNVVAQVDGGGNVLARYVFGSKPNVPDYLASASGTFRILSDHLGSPRLIVNAATGAVVEQVDYDEFGRVTNDTQPGLTPFGFAGGLYEPQTGLVRFGARDYDPQTGRWTSKDPLGFGGGTNLYRYVLNDPLNFIDPLGKLPDWLQSVCEWAGFCKPGNDNGGQPPEPPEPPNINPYEVCRDAGSECLDQCQDHIENRHMCPTPEDESICQELALKAYQNCLKAFARGTGPQKLGAYSNINEAPDCNPF